MAELDGPAALDIFDEELLEGVYLDVFNIVQTLTAGLDSDVLLDEHQVLVVLDFSPDEGVHENSQTQEDETRQEGESDQEIHQNKDDDNLDGQENGTREIFD